VAALGRGLGCDATHVVMQHDALIITVRCGGEVSTQAGPVGEHGVNLRRLQEVSEVVERVGAGSMDQSAARAVVLRLAGFVPGYPGFLVNAAVGLACASFSRLLDADAAAFLPTLAGAAIGQGLRRTLMHRGQNAFLTSTLVSLAAALLSGVAARWAGSEDVAIAMFSSILFLVPGVPALNALDDVLQGHPGLGTARMVRVITLLAFMAVGLAIALAALELI
jgi:uncharacterized membrane protein YjjP (DUF1212 family)